MNKKPNPDRALIHFMLRAQQIARQDGRSDQGYAMLLVSMISIALFSMLAAYMTMTNLNKSSTSAYVDGTNTFYVAESGLNRRAQELREKFLNYSLPTGLSPGTTTVNDYVSPTNITNCFNSTANQGTVDFQCQNFDYNHTDTATATVESNTAGSSQTIDIKKDVIYKAYTFVADRTNYVPGSTPRIPQPVTIPSTQVYAGLNAMEYWYTVYSTAAKPDPLNAANPVQQSNAKTVLQMDFKSRVVPLFQFGVFYNEDLEMTSTSTMTLTGRVHTNANLYAQPTPTTTPAAAAPTGITTYFYSPVTAAGNIYNRNDASFALLGTRYSAPRVLRSGNPFTGSPAPVFYPDSNFRTSMTAPAATATTPLSPTEIAAFGTMVKDGQAGATVLRTPDAGFLRKRNYFNNNIGQYYSKADMRLEMVPDRDVTSKAATPWTRDSRIIPFNFTSIQTGGIGVCTTLAPAAGSDPANTYVDSNRNDFSSLHCNVFTKGQLQSLRQPVMVLTNINQPTAALRAAESATLNQPTYSVAASGAIPTGIATSNYNAILRALQVALVSTPSPVTTDQLNKAFSDGSYGTDSLAVVNGTLSTFKATFSTLINATNIPSLTPADRTALLSASPNAIAALQGAWFLPAPVQRIEHNQTAVRVAANPRNSGFYDGRERRWITMLQTNLASLSVWNRDGLYVKATTAATGTASIDSTMTTRYSTNADMQAETFNSGNGANFTTGLAFAQAPAAATTVATCSLDPFVAGGAQRCSLTDLGMGARDATENGLVLHATVNDDLDGDGAIVAANDVTTDSANPIFRKRPNGTNELDSSGNPITVDYPRKYLNVASTVGGVYRPNSPFGFAFNGGNYLPGAMTLVTDQSIYIQGNYNNNGATQPASPTVNVPSPQRLPAAIMGDTITILSNQCLTGLSSANFLTTPGGQIDCGIPSTATGSVNNGLGVNYYTVTSPIAVNAAFLSSTMRSCGNLGLSRACPTGVTAYSGGLNNYMRMLEDWGAAQNFNYSGSFVSLGTPLEYSGAYFGGGTYYNIPVRNYNFDNNFSTFSLLPPLSPSAIYLQQNVFKRTYN